MIQRNVRPRPRRKQPRRDGIKDRKLPATTHHIREYGSPKNDHWVIRLVGRLHLHDAGMDSIERIGKPAFERKFSIDLRLKASELYASYRVDPKGALL